MKIGIIGTSSSGKTTLAEQLVNYFHFELIPEFARHYSSKWLEKESVQYWLEKESVQYDILLNQIYHEILSSENIITDRTIIDNYIYLEKRFKPKKYILNLVRSWAETYDIILLCKKFPFVDDGFRTEFDIEHDIIRFLDCNNIKYEIIDGNKDERFQKAKEIIEAKWNQ